MSSPHLNAYQSARWVSPDKLLLTKKTHAPGCSTPLTLPVASQREQEHRRKKMLAPIPTAFH